MRSESQMKNDDKDRYILRFRESGQRAVLKERAARNHRSLNAEILCLIDRALEFDTQCQKENAPLAGTGEALSAVNPFKGTKHD